MMRTVRLLALTAVFLVLFGTSRLAAQQIVVVPPGVSCYAPPVVSYYAPAPVVSYYAPPRVSYYPAPSVSYYAPATVSYYAPPAVSYYAPATVSYYAAPGAVTTTRYGLFGRPRVSTTYYP